jgi:hypothetical protein
MTRGKGRHFPPLPERDDPGLRGPGRRFCRCGKLALTKEDAQRRAEAETLAEASTTGRKKGVYQCDAVPGNPWWHTYTVKSKNGSQKKRAKRRRQQMEDVLAKAREVYGLMEKETKDEEDTDA